MSKRKRQQLGDSFDLFLDTITNTFGGVLLIALLIVLMIRENAQSQPKEFQAGASQDLQVVQSSIVALVSERNTLAANLKVQQQFSDDFQGDDLKDLVQELSQELLEKSKVEKKAAELSLEVKKVLQSRRGLEATEQQLKEALAARRAQYQRLSQQLNAEQEKRTRTMALPKESETVKDEVPIILKNNEMFVLNANHNGGRFQLNYRHFQPSAVEDADVHIESSYLKTIAGSGMAIGSEEMKRTMGRYNDAKCHFTFVVKSDSFESFSKVREECVNNGFEYRILATDETVGESASERARTQ